MAEKEGIGDISRYGILKLYFYLFSVYVETRGQFGESVFSTIWF